MRSTFRLALPINLRSVNLRLKLRLKPSLNSRLSTTVGAMLTVWLSLFIAAFAQAEKNLTAPVPQANHITRLGNINLGEVNQIFQAKNGQIWLATGEGLIHFDGYNAKRFVHDDNDPHSLSHNVVMDVLEDSVGNLWISTYGGGLNKFTPQTGIFEKIDLTLGANDQFQTESLYQLALASDGILWVCSTTGLKWVDTNSSTVMPLPQILQTMPKKTISEVIFDSQQRAWMGSYYDGVFLYDPKHPADLQQFEHNPDEVNTLGVNKVRTLGEDEHGTIWVGTANSLNRFTPFKDSDKKPEQGKGSDKLSGFFTPFASSDHPEMDDFDSDIFAIQSDHQGKLWLGSVNRGVHTFDLATQTFTPVSGLRDFYQYFKRSRINDIMRDKDGALWFATGQGIILLSQTAQYFQYLSNPSGSLKISDVKQLNSGKMLMVGGFELYDVQLQANQARSREGQPPRVFRVTEDNNDNLWLATIGSGLQQWSATAQQLTSYADLTARDFDFPMAAIFDTFVDNSARLWAVVFPEQPHTDGGLAQFVADDPSFEYVMTTPNLSDIVQLDDQHIVLTSDYQGVYSLNPDTRQVTPWQPTIASTPQHIRDAHKDSQGNLWLGTEGQGLALYDADKKQFSFVSVADGLLSNNIVSVTEDKDQRLWLGSPIGLSRYDPVNKTILNIEQQDGLLFTRFYPRSAFASTDGLIAMGTTSGLIWFNPDDFNESKSLPEVIISDFKLFNQPVPLQSSDPQSPLVKPIEFTEQITLGHQDYVFSFAFSVPEYTRPDTVMFAYQMIGLDDKWVITDATNRVASYTTLPAGDYVFNVKAGNVQGQWSEQITSVKVTILPPWWLSLPAYISYFLLIISSIYLFIRLRTQKLRERADILEQSVTQRTQELKNSHDQLALQSQTVSNLLAQKQRLFASVSHEFRTPLTLILSPVDQLLSQPKGQPISKELTLIKRSGRRLLRMVDQLLEFAKLEQLSSTDSQSEPISLEQTLNIIIASFEPLVSSKQISLHVDAYEDVTLMLLPDSLNKILINILSNAFKYTPANGDIWVSVVTINERVDIIIKDSGIGIAQSDHQSIFERFNRATHNHGESISGAGIGLALVKELVEANQGHISLTSELSQGSTFTISLPVASAEQTALAVEGTAVKQILHDHLDLEIDSVLTVSESIVNETADIASELKTLLIVDDSADMRNLLSDQLSRDYHCLLAEHGESGLNIAREQLPDLVISDVMMPVMDGYEFTSALKGDELTSHIPVILLTAKGSMESRLKGLQLLVDDYLAKPFNIEELRLRIHNILSIREIIRKRFSQQVDSGNAQTKDNKDSGLNETDQCFFDKLSQQLEQHYNDTELTAKVLCNTLGISERQLMRKLKALLGLGFSEWVRNYRLNKSCELLNQGHRASQVYFDVGFSSHSYFSSCFKAKFGVTPKQYQSVETV